MEMKEFMDQAKFLVFCMKNYNCSSHFFWALLRKFITFSAHIIKVSTVNTVWSVHKGNGHGLKTFIIDI